MGKQYRETEDADLCLEVLVEIPQGSRNKYEYDHERGAIRLDRTLFSSVHYPCDYGFVPETLAEDGDALDALVLVWEPTFPGCVVDVRAVGMLVMKDEKGADHKLLCVPLYDPVWNHVRVLEDVPPHLLLEIDNFFRNYKELEGKKTKTKGWEGLDETRRIIHECRLRHGSGPE